MNVWRLVTREIRHRKLNFALGVLSVLVAVGCLVGQLTLLRAHDVRSEELLAAKEAEARVSLAQLEDDYRKIMKEMGFNVLILPAGEESTEFRRADKTMPEQYVKKLSNSRTMTVQHLLPILYQSMVWPEMKRSIHLVGTRGEVPMMHRDPKQPILTAVPPGEMVIGYDLWTSLKIKVGDKVKLLGEEFTVSKCQDEWDLNDDMTVWIDLAEAQRLLSKEGRINVIQALKCRCPGMDMSDIRDEIVQILPGTRVKFLANKVTARAKARDRAKAEHARGIAAEKQSRHSLRQTREQLAAYLVPLVIVGCTVWIGLLALGNVRERRGEIGILRAIGVSGRQVFAIFLSKALLMGLGGACLGYAAGMAVGLAVGAALGDVTVRTEVSHLLSPVVLLLVLAAAPLLSAAATWAPAMIAARQDPADVLGKE